MARRAEEILDPYFSDDEVNIRISRRARSEYGRLLSRFNERTRRWKVKTHEKFRRDVNALFRCLRFQERLEVYRCRRHWRFRIAIAVERDEEKRVRREVNFPPSLTELEMGPLFITCIIEIIVVKGAGKRHHQASQDSEARAWAHGRIQDFKFERVAYDGVEAISFLWRQKMHQH